MASVSISQVLIYSSCKIANTTPGPIIKKLSFIQTSNPQLIGLFAVFAGEAGTCFPKLYTMPKGMTDIATELQFPNVH